MEKKYRLLEDDTITVGGRTLYRIEALRDFANVKKGEKGGYVESEDNLSHKDNCWVYDDARVFGKDRVTDNTWVADTARMCGNVCVYGKARVFGDEEIRGGEVTSGVIYK